MAKRLIVGLYGADGAGKSTAAKILCERHGFVELAVKAQMVRALCVMFQVPSTVFSDPETKDKQHPALYGHTPRQIQKSLGTHWGRNMVHEDIWLDTLKREVAQYPTDHIVIPDVRYNNIARYIKAMDGVIIGIDPMRSVESEYVVDPSYVTAWMQSYEIETILEGK